MVALRADAVSSTPAPRRPRQTRRSPSVRWRASSSRRRPYCRRRRAPPPRASGTSTGARARLLSRAADAAENYVCARQKLRRASCSSTWRSSTRTSSFACSSSYARRRANHRGRQDEHQASALGDGRSRRLLADAFTLTIWRVCGTPIIRRNKPALRMGGGGADQRLQSMRTRPTAFLGGQDERRQQIRQQPRPRGVRDSSPRRASWVPLAGSSLA